MSVDVAPKPGRRSGISIVGAILLAMTIIGGSVSVATPAQASWTTFLNAWTAPNVWKWSGHHWTTGVLVELTFAKGPVAAMISGSSTTYGSDNQVFLTWSSSFSSIACAQTGPDSVALYCRRQS